MGDEGRGPSFLGLLIGRGGRPCEAVVSGLLAATPAQLFSVGRLSFTGSG